MKIISDFERLRAFTLKLISKVDSKAAERIPEGFHNNLHWQLGHLLYVQDQCFFLWSGHASCLGKGSAYFGEYFGIGTSPKSFDSLVPDWDELLALAKRHSQGLQGVIGSRLAEPLRKPYQFMNMKMLFTSDTLPFMLAHEGEHIGHIKRLVKAVGN
jgi:DinB superfamily